jgi:hypothetical protein
LIYAEPDPDHEGRFRAVVADDTGYEGIACLDDTARAAVLALGAYERGRSPSALTLARRWLSFVEYMQYPDGSFANFVRNAAGTRNATGPTSMKGGYWWSVRALWALARAYRLTGESRYRERYEACRLEPLIDGKINALLALGRLELYAGEPSDTLRGLILEACDRVFQTAGDSDYFLDTPGDELIHLWGYHQMHAIAAAAFTLERPDLLRVCRKTVRTVTEPAVRARFWHSFPDMDKAGICAYDVSPAVMGLAAMYRATGTKRFRDLAIRGSAWLYGRNDARTPMYDPTTGRCRDGINDGRASTNYGAESAIEAGFIELTRRDLLETSPRAARSAEA